MSVRQGFLYKNQRADRSPPNISFPALLSEQGSSTLCPVEALRHYLSRSQALDNNPSLFINPLTSANLQRPSISLWLCRIIEEFSPNGMPRAHDVRKQAASLAWVKGIAPNEIIQAAFWSTSNIL